MGGNKASADSQDPGPPQGLCRPHPSWRVCARGESQWGGGRLLEQAEQVAFSLSFLTWLSQVVRGCLGGHRGCGSDSELGA